LSLAREGSTLSWGSLGRRLGEATGEKIARRIRGFFTLDELAGKIASWS
jgi:hypothetical protein